MGRPRRPAVTPMGLAGTAVTLAALTLAVRGRQRPPRRPAPHHDAPERRRWMPLLLIPGA
ncbi:hypothetical protein [Streptomyces sp. CB03234]|uniref:hypothetical protein n=1 Tax=Streptomyces sp. (strain CB03234) TaxID=1703937 RepID=UPI00117E2BE4|nr:hypothetical protein [Streptomyces sp. CB03234]